MSKYNVPENNSLRDEIEELLNICEELEDEFESEFFDGIDEMKIDEWENMHSINLPDTYKEWLCFSNGAIVLDTLARIYSLEQVNIDDNECSDDNVIIGEVIGDGTRLCFSKTTSEFIWYDHGKQRKYADFRGILEKLLLMI